MQVSFWGTRGSLPVAQTAHAVHEKLVSALMAANDRSFSTRAEASKFALANLGFAGSHSYGGASSCVEIVTDANGSQDAFILCDLGSGAREFGLSAMSRCAAGHARTYHIFLSHLHWDHIMGFPFFVPAFDPEAHIVIHSGHADAEKALRRQQDEISFPVPFDWLRARIEFVTLEPGRAYAIGSVTVEMMEQRHSHVSYGYRFTDANGRVTVYSTDSEHKLEDMEAEAHFAAFFADADLVICDTMYSLAESVSMKEDWGHSSNIVAIDLCHEAGAKRLALVHHEPTYSDTDIERMHGESIRYEELTRRERPLEVLCAYDGLVVAL